ncbi:MAG: response regulator [Deltaproteobacteria bacterium]|nr:MAG: response regulator [Deltaproteobacteria bacterium]
MATMVESVRRLDLSGRLVLVVEDNESCAEAVSDWLASCGALVQTADSVQGALERVRVVSPDLALVDICLPDGSGWDCVDRIRTATASGKPMPVIAITGYAQRDVADQAEKHGVRYVVTKPIEPDALATVLDACLDAAA